MGETDTLKKWINESNYIVFFGGAGVSTESNIPDFRSTDGLFIETHPEPSQAKSDGANMLRLDLLEDLLTRLVRLRQAIL